MDNEKECCPRFDPKLWDEKEKTFDEKLFIKDSVPQFMHIPLPGSFGKTVSRMWKLIEDSNARPADDEVLMLSCDPSPWKSDLFINVTKRVEGAENVRISGDFLTKVFDGPFNHVPKWIKEMTEYVGGKGKPIKRFYFYYTTCPKCAKKYGHNYVVVFAEV